MPKFLISKPCNYMLHLEYKFKHFVRKRECTTSVLNLNNVFEYSQQILVIQKYS